MPTSRHTPQLHSRRCERARDNRSCADGGADWSAVLCADWKSTSGIFIGRQAAARPELRSPCPGRRAIRPRSTKPWPTRGRRSAPPGNLSFSGVSSLSASDCSRSSRISYSASGFSFTCAVTGKSHRLGRHAAIRRHPTTAPETITVQAIVQAADCLLAPGTLDHRSLSRSRCSRTTRG